jgi:hypothetical protein
VNEEVGSALWLVLGFFSVEHSHTRGDDTLNSKSSKEATMVSPYGLTIALVKHIKEHE